MAIAPAPRRAPAQDEPRFLIEGVDWQTYETLLHALGSHHVRMTYDRGRLELRSPSSQHEAWKKRIARLLEALTEELNIPIRSAGSTTLRQRAAGRGLEPDECYDIQGEPLVRDRRPIDPTTDLPPDLAVEVDLTSSSIPRDPIYAALRIAELWRFDGESLRVDVLQEDGSYAERDESPSLPFLPLDEFRRFLRSAEATNETAWVRSFRAGVQDKLGAHRRPEEGATG